jgi:hypothetical protein
VAASAAQYWLSPLKSATVPRVFRTFSDGNVTPW